MIISGCIYALYFDILSQFYQNGMSFLVFSRDVSIFG